MNFQKAPVEVIGLPHRSMGKSFWPVGHKHKHEHITLSWGTVWGCLSLLFQKMLKFSFPSCPSNSCKQLPRSFLKQWQVWDLLRQKGKAAGLSRQRSFECDQVLPARCRETNPHRNREQQLLQRHWSWLYCHWAWLPELMPSFFTQRIQNILKWHGSAYAEILRDKSAVPPI